MPAETPVARSPLVTVTLFGLPGARAWAFAQMGLARGRLADVEGLRFWKMLGSGSGDSFSLRPNLERYGLFAVWETPEAADAFFLGSAFLERYRRRAAEVWTARLAPVAAHGAWSGTNPLLPLARGTGADGPVAVLTRASIRWRKLPAFWRAVPGASRALERAPGRIASIGVGEAPFVRQATFSFWKSAGDVQAYAYRDPAHAVVVRRTRDEGWYSEELFARFAPLSSEGTWNGRDPLEGLL